MPRTARKISKSGFYHIIIRGVNKGTIFIENEDRYMFLRLLKYYKTKYECEIYAYCLMSNHVHLLVKDKNLKLGELMKNITCVYAGKFNKKYKRVGHLFQDRFKSKNIENQEYLLRVIRYIHRNPEKAGICKTENYIWSSYKEVIYGAKIINRDLVLKIYGNNKFSSINEFKKQMTEQNNDLLDLVYIKNELTDTEVNVLIKDLVKTKKIPEITEKNIIKVVNMINKFKGISKTQILRVLGINRNLYYSKMKKIKQKGSVPFCL